MSSMIMKAKYTDAKTYNAVFTRFGAIESDSPHIYEKHFSQGSIIRLDLLDAIECKVGAEVIDEFRDQLYAVISGSPSIETNEEYQNLFEYIYLNYHGFRMWIEEAYSFLEEDANPITAYIEPLRVLINNHKLDLKDMVTQTGAIFLKETHDYIYIMYRHQDIPDLSPFRTVTYD